MSVFSEEDIRALSIEGNVSFNAKYLAHYNTHDPLPNGSDVNKLKEFIKSKYLDKRWHVDSQTKNNSGSTWATSGNQRSVRTPPLTAQDNYNQYSDHSHLQMHGSNFDELISFDTSSAAAATQKLLSTTGFDAFGFPGPSQQQQQQGFGGGFSNFDSPPPQQAQALMPYIRLAPPAPASEHVAPVAAAAPAAGEKAPKNFSAFDDFLVSATSDPWPGPTVAALVKLWQLLFGAADVSNPSFFHVSISL